MTNNLSSPTDVVTKTMSSAVQTAMNSANSLFNTPASMKTISGGRRGRKSRRVKSKKSTKKYKRKTHHKKRKGFSFNLF
jgi:hypothetical protein